MRVRSLASSPFLFFCFCIVAIAVQSRAQQAPEIPASTTTLQINTNRVLIPVVVRDKSGHYVSGLTKDDFEVRDNGKRRDIRSLMVEGQEAETSQPGNSSSPDTGKPEQRFVVFLVDDLHLNNDDLMRIQNAGAAVLRGALEPNDIAALVTVSGMVHTNLTRDRSKLLDALKSVHVRASMQGDSSECPNIDYYQAVEIAHNHSHDDPAYRDAFGQVVNCNPVLDPKFQENIINNTIDSTTRRVLAVNRQDIASTYSVFGSVLRAMSKFPGKRILVLVSPGFLSIEEEFMIAESRVVDLAVQSNVAISALDARGLYITSFDASHHIETPHKAGRGMQPQADYFASTQNAAESTMASLAYGTGGLFFHNNNDLQDGFKSITERPKIEYVLELAVDELKPDGTYHQLKVKVRRPGTELQARRGYFLPMPPKNGKKR